MHRGAELGDFLRSRRARLTPPDLGLAWPNGGRRVHGLRREEVALAAGVSADYYTRLEQGRARNVSDQVLDAVARALRLDDLETRHLFALTRPAAAARRTAPEQPPKPRAALRAMLDSLDPTPAIIHGPRLEVLGINRMGKVLLDDFEAMPLRERNMARWTFLDPRARRVYREWDVVAPQMVAILRLAAGRHAEDPALAELVAELTARSDQFARWWADHPVFQHTHGTKLLHHELVGPMTINYQSLALPADPGQSLIIYTADTGSPSEEKLRLLSSWASGPGDLATGSARLTALLED
ncbi:transcriptional regulator with XRE-family HTH domain [Micromonospora palomenae]|uniref:Transcriptional regulator with XRE-family HTH domain n=1 Tax=Micromonospora palomenae TaxID=1461247 RepID=A0A561VFB5_9ACTN|nr:helix-turn-helix transcriptional regulator [Micromonospora palomenae]TWG10288.1 transcriptional regulator with XRE-family HTH domain [Micromonospora palomenae]